MAASRPTSETEICNLALDLLSQRPITSIDTPSTPAAEVCSRWYHPVRAALLRKHPWKFASKRGILTSVSNYDIPFGYENAYALPSDFIRLLGVGDDTTGIITNDSGALLIRYIYDVLNVNKMDSLFVDMLVMSLALRISSKFRGSETRTKEIAAELKSIAPGSYSIDGQERPPTRIQRSNWISRRRMNGSRGYGSPYVTFGENYAPQVRYQLEDGYILTGLL